MCSGKQQVLPKRRLATYKTIRCRYLEDYIKISSNTRYFSLSQLRQRRLALFVSNVLCFLQGRIFGHPWFPLCQIS